MIAVGSLVLPATRLLLPMEWGGHVDPTMCSLIQRRNFLS